jgi:hypothetical protein
VASLAAFSAIHRPELRAISASADGAAAFGEAALHQQRAFGDAAPVDMSAMFINRLLLGEVAVFFFLTDVTTSDGLYKLAMVLNSLTEQAGFPGSCWGCSAPAARLGGAHLGRFRPSGLSSVCQPGGWFVSAFENAVDANPDTRGPWVEIGRKAVAS